MFLYYKINNKYRIPFTIFAILLGVVLNYLFHLLNNTLSMPFFLDSIFTVMVAALFGLIPAIFTGLFTNLLMEVMFGFPGYLYPFAIVNICTGVVTALMVKRGALKEPLGLLYLILVLALVNSFVGAIVVTAVFDGITNQQLDSIVRAVIITGQSVFSSAFLARILVNLVDKGIAVLITYIVYRLISRSISSE